MLSLAAMALLMVTIVAVLPGGPAHPAKASDAQQVGPPCEIAGPDAYGYTCQSIAIDFHDISSTGDAAPLFFNDFMTPAVAMGVAINFYGTTYTDAYFCTNGFVTFTGGQTCPAEPSEVPSADGPDNLIAGLWNGHDISQGTIYTQATTLNGESVLIAQYDDVGYQSSASTDTWQGQFYASDCRLEFHYLDGNGDGTPYVVGIENTDGSTGLRFASDTDDLTGRAVRFTPPFGCDVEPPEEPNLRVTEIQPSLSTPIHGEEVRFKVTVANLGGATAGASTTRLRLDTDTNLASFATPSLLPGATAIHETDPWTATTGDHRIEAFADDANAIPESNELDNALELPFFVAPAPLAASVEMDAPSFSPTDTIGGTVLAFRDGTDLPVPDADVTVRITYDSGQPILNGAWETLECRTFETQGTTDPDGAFGFTVPPALLDRCLDGPGIAELPTQPLGGAYRVEASVRLAVENASAETTYDVAL